MGPVLDGRAVWPSVYFWSLRSFLPGTRLGWQGPCTVVGPRGPAMKKSLEEKVLSPCIQAQGVCLFLIPALALGCGPPHYRSSAILPRSSCPKNDSSWFPIQG